MFDGRDLTPQGHAYRIEPADLDYGHGFFMGVYQEEIELSNNS
ncbi:MAG: hypothetical protein A4E63_02868 [Syntrophorhabdus sp. PtaU1.Bin050]|nr:MAG: hypothetical protein A4E63_02868 [Syntrophorhabdus sp. PtaU1.Bin050]